MNDGIFKLSMVSDSSTEGYTITYTVDTLRRTNFKLSSINEAVVNFFRKCLKCPLHEKYLHCTANFSLFYIVLDYSHVAIYRRFFFFNK